MKWPWHKDAPDPIFSQSPGAALDEQIRQHDGTTNEMLSQLRSELAELRALYDALAVKVAEQERRFQEGR